MTDASCAKVRYKKMPDLIVNSFFADNTWQNNKEFGHPSDKIWSVYLSQAEKYDKALVETWKSDMAGILIFVSDVVC